MNTFDAVVYFVGIVAIISGFKAGLLRSVATIIGYLTAMPIALAATPPRTNSARRARPAPRIRWCSSASSW
jgi:uncharacterized membrane protein required for colicin V production